MAGLDIYEAVVEQHEQGLGERFRYRGPARAGPAGSLRNECRGRLLRLRARCRRSLLVERDRRYAALSELLDGFHRWSSTADKPFRDRRQRSRDRRGRDRRRDRRLMTGHVRRVAVLDANREHVSLLRDSGLRLDELGSERIVRSRRTSPSPRSTGRSISGW